MQDFVWHCPQNQGVVFVFYFVSGSAVCAIE
jgi:hypothetical protein